MAIRYIPIATALLIGALATNCRADDICSAGLGRPAATFNPVNMTCFGDGGPLMSVGDRPLALIAYRLQVQTDAINSAKQAEAQANAELKAAVNNLATAIANLGEISKSISSAQIAWRNESLKKTLAEVSAVPARLAEEQSLRSALLASLQADLAANQAFIEELRHAIKQ